MIANQDPKGELYLELINIAAVAESLVKHPWKLTGRIAEVDRFIFIDLIKLIKSYEA